MEVRGARAKGRPSENEVDGQQAQHHDMNKCSLEDSDALERQVRRSWTMVQNPELHPRFLASWTREKKRSPYKLSSSIHISKNVPAPKLKSVIALQPREQQTHTAEKNKSELMAKTYISQQLY